MLLTLLRYDSTHLAFAFPVDYPKIMFGIISVIFFHKQGYKSLLIVFKM